MVNKKKFESMKNSSVFRAIKDIDNLWELIGFGLALLTCRTKEILTALLVISIIVIILLCRITCEDDNGFGFKVIEKPSIKNMIK